MGLVRKKSLSQLDNIYKMMKKNDLGTQTTKDYPMHVDVAEDLSDIEWEDSYDQSNEIIGTYGMGNFGEFYGDITNDGKYSNLLFVHNPLDSKKIPAFEDFGTMSGFGDWWKNRDPKKVQKFDRPDEEENYDNPMKESLDYKDKEIKSGRIKNFNEFINKK